MSDFSPSLYPLSLALGFVQAFTDFEDKPEINIPKLPNFQDSNYGHSVQAFADRQGKKASAGKAVFETPIENFYLTDAISRSSQTMAKCVQARRVMPTDFAGRVGPSPSYGVNKAAAN